MLSFCLSPRLPNSSSSSSVEVQGLGYFSVAACQSGMKLSDGRDTQGQVHGINTES